MYFKGQKFFVAGMSVSGESSARFLLERGADVYIYDDVVSDKVREVRLQNFVKHSDGRCFAVSTRYRYRSRAQKHCCKLYPCA